MYSDEEIQNAKLLINASISNTYTIDLIDKGIIGLPYWFNVIIDNKNALNRIFNENDLVLDFENEIELKVELKSGEDFYAGDLFNEHKLVKKIFRYEEGKLIPNNKNEKAMKIISQIQDLGFNIR